MPSSSLDCPPQSVPGNSSSSSSVHVIDLSSPSTSSISTSPAQPLFNTPHCYPHRTHQPIPSPTTPIVVLDSPVHSQTTAGHMPTSSSQSQTSPLSLQSSSFSSSAASSLYNLRSYRNVQPSLNYHNGHQSEAARTSYQHQYYHHDMRPHSPFQRPTPDHLFVHPNYWSRPMRYSTTRSDCHFFQLPSLLS